MTQPEMERAFYAGDARYNGRFVAGIRGTGVFCRPSCTVPRPHPNQVEYCRTVRDALFTGYRPCPRCLPMAPGETAPSWVAPLMAAVEAEPARRWRAADLRARGLNPEVVRSWFQRTHGLTFAGWCRALRLGRAFVCLRDDMEIDAAASGPDFDRSFREALADLCGAPPAKSSGKELIVATLVRTPLGPMVAAAVDRGLCLLEFSDRRMLQAQLQVVSRRLKLGFGPGEHPHLQHLRAELEAYFAHRLRTFTVPLFTPGTPFQTSVWSELRQIPCGETITYETLARRAGKPAAVRAAGHANGMNPVSILVPCHRVVGKDGALCGYGGGLWRKRFLLDLEQGKT